MWNCLKGSVQVSTFIGWVELEETVEAVDWDGWVDHGFGKNNYKSVKGAWDVEVNGIRGKEKQHCLLKWEEVSRQEEIIEIETIVMAWKSVHLQK